MSLPGYIEHVLQEVVSLQKEKEILEKVRVRETIKSMSEDEE